MELVVKWGHCAAENRKVEGLETQQARDILTVTQELGNSAEITAPGFGVAASIGEGLDFVL